MSIKAVVFDFGGVLVQTRSHQSREQLAQRLGVSRAELEKIVFDSEIAIAASIGEHPVEQVWEHVGQRFNLTPAQAAQFPQEFFADDVRDEELVAFLKSLRPHYQTAILSNAWSNARQLFTETYALDEAVDFFLISAEERIAKPDPRIYTLLAQRLGVRPEEIIFLDDFIRNITAAREAGIHAVHYSDTPTAIAEMRALLAEDGSGSAG